MESKKELIEKANKLAEEHQLKKELIESILNDLDKNKELTEAHINSMGIIQDILKELDILEDEYEKIKLKIKN